MPNTGATITVNHLISSKHEAKQEQMCDCESMFTYTENEIEEEEKVLGDGDASLCHGSDSARQKNTGAVVTFTFGTASVRKKHLNTRGEQIIIQKQDSAVGQPMLKEQRKI